jgi:hypothetical protein
MWSQTTNFKPRAVALACAAVLAGCGGGGGASDGTKVQSIEFNYPGGKTVAVPPDVATVKLVATASGGGAVTFSSNTPDTCTVSGDVLSLVKAGECSVSASQAGGNGYAPALARQLFVIPKIKTAFTFPNPGWQPLDTTPVQLSATSAKGFPISFASKTPDVCTVNGTTLSKVGNGVCTVTATATGDDFYATMTVNKNIPIGTATAPQLTFLTGYKDVQHTNEGVVGYPGSQWWTPEPVSTKVSADHTSYTFAVTWGHKPTTADWYYNWAPQLFLFAPGLNETNLDPNSGYPAGDFRPGAIGVSIDSQAALKFDLAQNPEWFGSANNKFTVVLGISHFAVKNGNSCHVTLQATVQPTAAAADYSLGLKDQFAIGESCGLTGLDVWNELQTFSIAQITFGAVAPNDTSGYKTEFTLTGPIIFQ